MTSAGNKPKVERHHLDRLHAQGFSWRRISELVGLSFTTVRRYFVKNGVKPKRKPQGGHGKGSPNAHGGSQAGRSRAQAGRLARDKGKVGQREALRIVKYAFPDAKNRYSGEEQFNGDPGRDLNDTPGFCFQVQLAQRPTIELKLEEAQGSARENDIPVALTRRSSRKGSGRWLATLPAHLLMELIYFAKHAPAELPAPDFLEIG